MRRLVASSPGVRQCVSSSCNSHTPGFHTPLLHPLSGRRHLYAAKTPASPHRPAGLCLLSISAEELLVSVAGSRSSPLGGSVPAGSLVSRATPLSVACISCRSSHSTIPVLHTFPTKTKASNHAAESICGVRAAKVSRGPGEKVGVHPRPARRGLGVPTTYVRSRRCLSST